MATVIATANGNFGTAATWGTVSVADAASLLDSEANNTALTTSYVESAATTLGAVTIDGIAVKIATRAAAPAGTMSVRLATGAALVAGTEVTINVSDIQGTALLQNGWFFFKFAAPVLLLGATAYTVSAKTSQASMVNLYRNATAGNWSRMIRLTTTAAPGVGDNWFVLGEYTAPATFTARAVIWNITDATDFGGASTTLAGAGIGANGTLICEAAAATAYLLQESAVMDVWVGGTLSMGTIGTPIPRDSSATIQFDCAADGDFGLRVWGTLNMQGQSRLVGVTNHYVLLNANAAAGATALTTDSQLSAINGDDVAFASTTRTSTEGETKTLNADAGATTLSLSAGLTNAHSGTSPTQGEVIGVTRAVRIISTSTTFMTYTLLKTGCVVDADWAEWRYGGSSAAKPAIGWFGASGSVNLNKCAIRDCDTDGFRADLTAGVGSFTITDCVFWHNGVTGVGSGFSVQQATASVWTFTGCVIINNTTNGTGVTIADLGGTFSNIRVGGGGTGISFGEVNASSIEQPINGTMSGLTVHSTSSVGVACGTGVAGGTISNLTVWRTSSSGLTFSSNNVTDLLIDVSTFFGCSGSSVTFSTGPMRANITFRTIVSNGDTTFATTIGIDLSGCSMFSNLRIENGNFSTASGIKVAHSSEDILLRSSGTFGTIVLVNTTLAATTEILNSASMLGRSYIAYQKHEGASGTNKKVYPALGTVQYDSTTFRTASPSEQCAPSAAVATFKLETEPVRVAVASGLSCSISAWANKSADYNGNSPRLRVRANAAAGIAANTVSTHVGGASTWIQLTGAVGPVSEDCVLEFVGDQDGSAGQVNWDDWTATVS